MIGRLLIISALIVQLHTSGLAAQPSPSPSVRKQEHPQNLMQPLTQEEFEELLKGPTPDSAIAIEILNRGVLFEADEAALAHFRTLRRLDIRKRGDQKTIEEALKDAMSLRVERLKVFLFNYVGQCSEYQNQFKKLEYVIDSKVTQIPQLFDSDRDHRYKYVQSLALKTAGIELVNLSPMQLNNYWRSLHALQLLTGICSIANNELRVSSRVILGDLKGPFPSNLTVPDILVKTEGFADTSDIFSILILFSLAEEAKIRGLGSDIIIAYLGKALEIIERIEPSVSMRSIQDGINSALRDLKSNKAPAARPTGITK